RHEAWGNAPELRPRSRGCRRGAGGWCASGAMNRMIVQTGGQGADVDALLTRFFKREMPDPWPAFSPPLQANAGAEAEDADRARPAAAATRRPRRARQRGFRLGSRLALAAVLALILGVTLLLPARLPMLPTGPSGPPVEGPGIGVRDPFGLKKGQG